MNDESRHAVSVAAVTPSEFYRFQELYEKGGEIALAEITKRKPILRNRVEPAIEQAVVELAIEQAAFKSGAGPLSSALAVR
jgi:hypothetical protein